MNLFKKNSILFSIDFNFNRYNGCIRLIYFLANCYIDFNNHRLICFILRRKIITFSHLICLVVEFIHIVTLKTQTKLIELVCFKYCHAFCSVLTWKVLNQLDNESLKSMKNNEQQTQSIYIIDSFFFKLTYKLLTFEWIKFEMLDNSCHSVFCRLAIFVRFRAYIYLSWCMKLITPL